MYFKKRRDILFREYEEFGYITDNSEYGYRMLDDIRSVLGEKFVSKSGAVMLATLGDIPKHIDDIVCELSLIFTGIDSYTLKTDTIEFFNYFVQEGYLYSGDTFEICQSKDEIKKSININSKRTIIDIDSDDSADKMFKPHELLRSIHIEVASACNERCIHCYIPHEDKTSTMDMSLFNQIIEEGRKMNIIHVTLSGGEPLLHKDIITILEKCRSSNLSVNVLSNLTLLTDEIVEEMKKNPLLSVQTSVYSMNPDVHDSITMLQGSLKKTLCGINKLCTARIPLQISCPIMKQNKDDFMGVIKWGGEHNISVAVDPVIFATYDHSRSNLSNRLSLEEIENVIDQQIKEEGYAESMCRLAREKEALTAEDPICSVCRYSFCISVSGEVYPCVGWQSKVLGNLNQETLESIWVNSEDIMKLRHIKRKDFAECVDCENRGYCTVCMMSNSNENIDANSYVIQKYHCMVAELIHKKIDQHCIK